MLIFVMKNIDHYKRKIFYLFNLSADIYLLYEKFKNVCWKIFLNLTVNYYSIFNNNFNIR